MLMTAKRPSRRREMEIVTMEMALESFVRVNPEKLSLNVYAMLMQVRQ
jgi:hypothetical protein